MYSIILLLYSLANTDKLIDRCFQLATEGKYMLQVYFAVEKCMPSSLSSIINHIGFLGDKVQEDVKQAIIEHYKAGVSNLRREIEGKALENRITTSLYLFEEYTHEDLVNIVTDDKTILVIINYYRKPDNLIKKILDLVKVSAEVYIDGNKFKI